MFRKNRAALGMAAQYAKMNGFILPTFSIGIKARKTFNLPKMFLEGRLRNMFKFLLTLHSKRKELLDFSRSSIVDKKLNQLKRRKPLTLNRRKPLVLAIGLIPCIICSKTDTGRLILSAI